MSQYGAYGLALQGVGYQAILARYYTGTQLAQLSTDPEVRVLLQSGQRKYTFTGAARIGTQALDPAKTYNVIRGGSGLLIRDGSKSLFTTAPPLRVDSAAGGALLLGGTSVPGVRDARYRGALRVPPVRERRSTRSTRSTSRATSAASSPPRARRRGRPRR